MKQKVNLIRARLKTPRAAALAGILFSVFLIACLLLLRLSVRADPLETGAWLKTSSKTVALALNLVPLAGIAFLWFIGVLRDRLGELEDRFFATVFFGSGLLFLAMLFASAAVAGGIIIAYGANPTFSTRGVLDPGRRSKWTSWSKGLHYKSDVLNLIQELSARADARRRLGR